MSPLEFWNIVKRRRYLFGLPIIGIALLTVFYALSVPAMYRSEATILIEDQKIPKDIIGATITNYASQQIQLISQRLFTVKNIKKVVEKFDVYGPTDPQKRVRAANLANRFRNDMELKLISAEMFDPSGRSIKAAVAFTLAFESMIPEVAQEVTQELVILFLNENQRSSASRTTDVSSLLTEAINEANEELLIAEAKLAEFKANNQGALPELYQLNMNVINRTERQLSDADLRIQRLQQRKLQLSAQLAPISPSAAVTLPSGEIIMSDRERLRALLIDYRRKMAIYEPDHPDLIRLEQEIDTLRKTVGDTGTYELLQEQLRLERERLNALRDRYSDNHPDIKYAEATIGELESQLAATNPRASMQVEIADNPAYVLINTQLQSNDLEIQSLFQKRRELQAIIAEYEALIKQAPQVEMHYEVLLRSYENSKTKYRDLQGKLRAADMATDVEHEITGRRFTLIEPPLLPIKPEPRYLLSIVTLGLLFAAGVGAACVVVAELVDNSIRGTRELTKIAGAPPLTVIPYLDNSVDIAHARVRRIYLFAVFFAGTALSIVYAKYLL